MTALPAPNSNPSEDELIDSFTSWAHSRGLELYPHQEEALFEIVTDSHVIASTPTGSGKSLIAVAAHAVALARGQQSVYTAPLKALVSEKFFDLVEIFGATNVGMLTGDSSINADAPIICCTAEVLANQVLREGEMTPYRWVIMDEFHFYADPQRGWAWQIPLLDMPDARFVLLSATLGDVTSFVDDLERRTGAQVAVIDTAQRPVPLTFSYVVESLQELLKELSQTQRVPAYVVHFTQAAAVTQAQALTSMALATRAERDAIAQEIGDFTFSRGFGQTLSRLLRHGIGVHHAGMLPRYRRLVERLTQAGLLKVICGTDTLGVGINVPIRTVVFTGLTKFDGVRSRHLNNREFHQIAGRAGRAGYDTRGEVIVMAPEHEIENAKALAKAGDDERKRRRVTRKRAPAGVVNWTEQTFERLRDGQPEALTSQFRITHALVLNVLARWEDPVEVVHRLVTDNHDAPTEWNPHVRDAIRIFRSLRAAGVIEHLKTPDSFGRKVRLVHDLPPDFALNAPLSPFALAALELLDPESESYALDVLSIIEATLEDPRPLVVAQEKAAKSEAIAEMKADGWDYVERMNALEEITHPKPLAELLEAALEEYATAHPWVLEHDLKPKAVVRDMVEKAMTFAELISHYSLSRSEGVVLRYLNDAAKALRQVVPEEMFTEELTDISTWLTETVRSVDSSLLAEWEALAAGDTHTAAQIAAGASIDDAPSLDIDRPITDNDRAFTIMVRNSIYRRLHLLDREDYEALASIDTGQAHAWNASQWAQAADPYWQEYTDLGTGNDARGAHMTEIEKGEKTWQVTQILADPYGDNDWRMYVEVDIASSASTGEPVTRVTGLAPLT